MTSMNRTKVSRLLSTDKDATRKVSWRSTATSWANVFRLRVRRHDPMLVLNMAAFNFDSGWDRILNPNKAHENGG